MNSKLPAVSIIAAVSENGVIGSHNKLLWNIPEDLKRFRTKTSGHPIIMGRKTHESIGHALPNRTNIIVTRETNFKAKGCIITHSIKEAIDQAKKIEQNEIFIIGGAQIYTQALAFTDTLYITQVHKSYEGDARFPDFSEFKTITFKEEHLTAPIPFTFLDVTR